MLRYFIYVFSMICRDRCPQRSVRKAAKSIAENLPIEVKFSDGTLRTAFPTSGL